MISALRMKNKAEVETRCVKEGWMAGWNDWRPPGTPAIPP